MATNPTFLNFRYGNQSSLPAFSAADKGTVYVTKDTNRLFIALPGETDYFNTGDFELVSFSSGTAKTALNARSLKRQNILYITVDKDNNTAMWRYNGTDFVAISNTAEIDGIKSDITDLKTAVSALNTFKDTTVPDTYMPKAGGTFSGNVSFASGKTLSVNAPTDNAHAATKQYVDSAKSALLGSSSATTTTNATIYDVKRAAAAAQVTANDAQTTATNAMPKSGGTFTGEVTIKEGVALIVNSEPSAGEHAANKTYVDKVAENAGKEIYGVIDEVVIGLLGEEGYNGTIKGAYEAAEDAKTAATGANNNANNRVLKSGDTMTGYLTLHSNPTDDMHAATKKYVVSQANSAQAAAQGHADGLASGIRGGYTGSMKDLSGSIEGLVTTTNGLLPKVNPTVTSGHLTLAEKTPDNEMHAASKGYVDAKYADCLGKANANIATAKTAILGTTDKGADYNGTVKGAYEAAAKAQTDATTAQQTADGKAPTNHASTATTYGTGNFTAYGHVKLDDSTTSTSSTIAGVAATPKAVNDARTALIGTSSSASSTNTIYGAKKYTDEQVAAVATNLSDLEQRIKNVTNIMNFVGKTDTAITDDGKTTTILKPSAIASDKTYTAEVGDVVIDKNGKECVYDGTAWRWIGDTTANSEAITALQGRMTTAETNITNLIGDVGTDDGKGTLFTRVAALESWESDHKTEYTTLSGIVSGHTSAIGAAGDAASASGSLYARIKQNAADISTLSQWKTTHDKNYNDLSGRVGALESWKTTHTEQYNNLNTAVTTNTTNIGNNTTAINSLTTLLTWGTF